MAGNFGACPICRGQFKFCREIDAFVCDCDQFEEQFECDRGDSHRGVDEELRGRNLRFEKGESSNAGEFVHSAVDTSSWPTIRQARRYGAGGRRLTMAPIQNKSPNWLVDATGYRPTTQGGIKQLKRDIAQDIKVHLFKKQGVDDDELIKLAKASSNLEISL